MPDSPRPVPRRALLGAGALAGLAALTTPAHASVPEDPVEPGPGPTPAPTETPKPGFVLWGSSSANSGQPTQYPDGERGARPKVRIEDVLAPLLGVRGYVTAIGGEISTQTLRQRSAAHPYRLDFSYANGSGVLPAQGGLVLPTTDRVAPAWRRVQPAEISGMDFDHHGLPGTIAGVPCTVQGHPHRFQKVVVTRLTPGEPVQAGTGTGSWWHTAYEEMHRGRVHLIWTGKNNIVMPDRVIADTRAIHGVEPQTSVVMGHWYAWADQPGTATRAAVDRVNASYRAEYGPRYFDTMAALRSRELWALPELKAYDVGYTAADKDWLARGLPPRQLVSYTDKMHLNALGNRLIAHALHRFLTGSAGLY